MPFRIKISLYILLGFLALVAVVPLLIPVPPLEDTVPGRDLADPDSLFVAVPAGPSDASEGLELHVKRYGPTPSEIGAGDDDAVPLLLLHGFGASLYSWREVAEPLATGGEATGRETGGARPVIAYDRPAFGLTERKLAWPRGANPYTPAAQVAQALALLDGYGIERAVLVGNSAGGALALRIALERPERVAGLVLVSAAVYEGGGAPAWSRPLLYTPQLERVGPLLMRQLGGEAGENFLRSAWADAEALPDEALELYRKALRADDWDRALWEFTQASRAPAAAGRLDEIAVPTLVLTGSEDAIVPPELSRRLATEIDGAELVELEGCGHLPQEECPQRFVAAVEGWLAATPLR